MKLNILYSLFILLTVHVSYSQNYVGTFSNDGKIWGYVDQNGKEIVAPKYTNLTEPSFNGYIGVFSPADKAYKLMNINGDEITIELSKIEYINVANGDDKDQKDDFFIVKTGKKAAIIDKNGKVVHAPEYDKISNFYGDVAFGNIGNTWFILKKSGEKIEIKEKLKDIKKLREGIAPFVSLEGKFGFLNDKGEIIVAAQYEGAGYFSSGLAWVRNTAKKIGFIDKTGKLVIEAKYDVVKEFDEIAERTIAKTGENFVILKKDGTEITVAGASRLKDFNEGIAEAQSGEKWGFVDKDGKWIVEAKYEKVESFENGCGRIRMNGLWGAVDKKGTVIIELKYASLDEFSDGKAAFKTGEKWGYVDVKGVVFVEANYSGAKKFKNGFALVKIGEKWGVIDTTGKEVIVPKYKQLGYFFKVR